ncbi:MAG TPA: hypothetical protein VHO90_10180 [Bacteroidales bacterium]|nr:hypothetical protein [Bacteroidales bacterium]
MKNTIPYRAMGYAAGALYKMKEYGKANYFYSLCYDSCAELKLSSYLSFHPQEENDWKECMALANNSRQQQVLWQLLGIYADPLRAMKQIYALDPKSDLLDLLLVRAINQEEEFFASSYKLADNKINSELLDFVKSVADKKNTTKPYLWNLGAGYLYTVALDLKKGETYLVKAESGAKNDALVKDQIHIIRLIAKVEQYNKPSAQLEQEMEKELTWLENYNQEAALRTSFTYDWMLSRLSAKYLAIGDTAKGTLLSREASPDFYRNDHKASVVIDFMEKPNKSAFDAHITKIYPVTINDIVRFQAVNAFYSGNVNGALKLFEKYPEAAGGDLPADPFLIHINDCHDCDHELGTEHPYTSQTLLKRILDLESQLSPGSKPSPNTYFLLANAYYNLSYFGNSRAFYYCEIPAADEYEWNPNNPIMDCTKALDYYKKAMELSTTNESRAKCCFMAAKCEQNNLYLAWPADYQGDFKSGTYFRKLKAEYSKTKYYQEILKECGYFRTFASSNRN